MRKKKKVSYAKYGYIFSIPFVLAFLVFTLYPIIYTVLLGFTDFKGMGPVKFHFMTNDLFANFKDVLTMQNFRISLLNTAMIWGVNFIPQIVLALLLAAIFTSNRRKIKGQGFFKVVFYMPNIITAASIAILFAALFAYPKGPMNDLLQMLHLSKENIYFFQNRWIARAVVAFIQFWMWYGYTMIVLISGILGINPELYEAADIDGANSVQKFFFITIPNLRTVLIYTLITSLVGGLTMYDIPKLLVQKSGPDNATLTSSVFIFNQAFSGSYKYSTAAAASMIMFIIIAILSAFIFFLMRDKDEIAEQKANKRVEKQLKRERKMKEKEAR